MRSTATLLVSFALLLTLVFALQNNSNLRQLRAEVKHLQEVIKNEKSRIAVLRVDYANITRISRLEYLAEHFLPDLRVAKTQQVRVLEAQDSSEEVRAASEPRNAREEALSYEAIK